MTGKSFTTVAATILAVLALSSREAGDGRRDVLPIMSWYSIPAEDASPERYLELAECGFNINFSHLGTLKDLQVSLDLAQRAGVKVMATCSELETATDSAVAAVKDHPALFGYFLRDEPLPAAFPCLAEWVRRIEKADGGEHPLYLNLLPNYVDSAALGCGYREYVRGFINEVKLPMVSFDSYPVTFDGIRSDGWYENLRIIHEESEAAGLPFWAFALSTAHGPYPAPTMESLRLELYTALAYGAQGLQYFTYWNPDAKDWDYHDAPIDQNRRKSEAYYLVQRMNRELQARASVFVGSKVISTAHLGDVMFRGCERMETLPANVVSLSASSDGAVVSLLEKGKWNYLVIVSRTLDRTTDIAVGFDRKAWIIDREGNAVKVAEGKVTHSLEAGDAMIFKYKKIN